MKKLYGFGFLGSIIISLIWFFSNGTSAASLYYSPTDLGAANYEQLNALLRDYLKTLDKLKSQRSSKSISGSGQMNSRTPRSEIGDLAHSVRLYQLAELDKMYGARSRPRFGKRSELITPEESPLYGTNYDSSASSDAENQNTSPDDSKRR